MKKKRNSGKLQGQDQAFHELPWLRNISPSLQLLHFILFTCYPWHFLFMCVLLYFPYWNGFLKGGVPILLIFDFTNEFITLESVLIVFILFPLPSKGKFSWKLISFRNQVRTVSMWNFTHRVGIFLWGMTHLYWIMVQILIDGLNIVYVYCLLK